MWQVRSVAGPRRNRRWLTVIALVPAIVLGLSACNSNSAPPQAQVIADKGTPFGDLLIPKLATTVKDGDVGVSAASPVTVGAEDGVLGAVSMVNEDGEPVQGKLSKDGLQWATTEPLGYNKRYTLTAEALGLGGATSRQMTFETHSPENLTMAYVVPSEGEVVGVGQPVAVQFDENIPNRLAAQQAIKITTTPPVEGAFYWLNNREVRWRPAEYWKPGTKVEVAVNTYGVDLGDGLFGQENITTHFSIGDEVITRVDDNTKTMTVTRNGEVIKTMPVSMGKNSTPTNNGTYIVGDRRSHMVMDSSTYGVPTNSPSLGTT
jgi:lipoprotein-anchoring transpeptidase ErfK/SrfK